MKLQNTDGSLAFVKIETMFSKQNYFHSVRGIKYEAYIKDNFICYRGGERNKGLEETMSKEDFITAFNAIKDLPGINTNTIKHLIPTSIYRKRTPFIGLLKSAGLLT